LVDANLCLVEFEYGSGRRGDSEGRYAEEARKEPSGVEKANSELPRRGAVALASVDMRGGGDKEPTGALI
jgi:hypothetical protein